MRVIIAKKDIYHELIPVQQRTLIKKIAYQFYQYGNQDLGLRKKIVEFKTLCLVLRSRNVEKKLDLMNYDRETLRFKGDNLFEFSTSPQVMFLTNRAHVENFIGFLIDTKMIKLYSDFSNASRYDHLMDSPLYSYLLNHNTTRLDPVEAHY